MSAFLLVRCLELYYKCIEYCKSHQLHLGENFDDTTCLSDKAKQDLNLIVSHIKSFNGKRPFREGPIDLIIESDTSNTGWGAACKEFKTHVSHSKWSLDELDQHINDKELQAAFFAVQAFCPLHKNIRHIRLKIDNTTTVANINLAV